MIYSVYAVLLLSYQQSYNKTTSVNLKTSKILMRRFIVYYINSQFKAKNEIK